MSKILKLCEVNVFVVNFSLSIVPYFCFFNVLKLTQDLNGIQQGQKFTKELSVVNLCTFEQQNCQGYMYIVSF